MSSSNSARVLVVAYKTAATPALIDAVRERAGRGAAQFTLLVPSPTGSLHRLSSDESHLHDEAGTAALGAALARALLPGLAIHLHGD